MITARSVALVCAFAVVAIAAPARARFELVPALRLDAPALAAVGGTVWAATHAQGGPGSGLRVDAAVPTTAATTAATTDVGAVGAVGREDFTLPEHYAWVERDTRAFWFATGTGAAATLATHVFVGLPALVFGSNVLSGIAIAAPVGVLALGLGVATTYLIAESALSAIVGTVVFSGSSETYDAHYLAAFGAHFVGDVLAAGVTGLTFGGGLLLMHGAGLLAEFTAGGGISTLALFSLLGAMPGVVVAGVALVVVPALVTSWAIAVTATPKPGYAIDDDWRKPTAALDDPRRGDRFASVGPPLATFALPVP